MERFTTIAQINHQLAPFARTDHKKSLREFVFTLFPYLAILTAGVFLFKNGISPLFLLPLQIWGGLFLVRTFIISTIPVTVHFLNRND